MNPIEENDSLEFLDFVRYRKRPKRTKKKKQLRTLAIFSHKAKRQKQNEETSLVLVMAFIISLKKIMILFGRCPGGRFSKDPVTYRARKAILETIIRLL